MPEGILITSWSISTTLTEWRALYSGWSKAGVKKMIQDADHVRVGFFNINDSRLLNLDCLDALKNIPPDRIDYCVVL